MSFLWENYLHTYVGTLDPSNILCGNGSENITTDRKQHCNWDRRRVEIIVLLSTGYTVSVNLMYSFGDS